jgi:hypothetical protein
VLNLCGCELGATDVSTLVERLEHETTVVSAEAAAAIRFADNAGSSADSLNRDLRDAITTVLHEPLTPGLSALRDALHSGCC